MTDRAKLEADNARLRAVIKQAIVAVERGALLEALAVLKAVEPVATTGRAFVNPPGI